jgi:hypothetical protein
MKATVPSRPAQRNVQHERIGIGAKLGHVAA